jgi:hypothetical protein
MKALRVAVALSGLVLAVAPAPVGRASAVPRAKLAGTTIVSTADSGWMPVTLPRDVTISTAPFDNPLITLTSGGPLSVVVLRQDVKRGVEVVYKQADLCRPDCKGQALSSLTAWDPTAKEFSKKMTLPAGRYQLYVIALEEPTAVRMKLPGLSGRTQLHPGLPVDLTSKEMRTTDPPSPYNFSAQVDHTVDGRGLSLIAAEADTDHFVAGNMSSCIEAADGETPAPVDDPTCEGGRTAGTGVVVNNLAEGGRKVLMSMGLLGRGAYEHQLRLRQASAIRSFHVRHLLLNYSSPYRHNDWLYSMSFMW